VAAVARKEKAASGMMAMPTVLWNGEAALSSQSVGSDAARRCDQAGSNILPEHRSRLLREVMNTFLLVKGQGRKVSIRDRCGQADPALGHVGPSSPCRSPTAPRGHEPPVY